jgi:cyclic pyranopterin phosphate synthase
MPQATEPMPLLSFSQIETVARLAAAQGIDTVRLTGGEPLMREKLWELVAALKKIPGIRRVTLTTNGVRFAPLAEKFAEAGLDGVNISLDTLEPDRFLQMTGKAALDQVLKAMDAALQWSIPLKVNCVLQPGVNREEWQALAELAKERALAVRFIEMMPIGAGKGCAPVAESWLREKLAAAFGSLAPCLQQGSGPAVYVKPEGFAGTIGFISAIHGRFCGTCNRLRLTADGCLKPCLCYEERIPLKPALDAGDEGEVERRIRQAIREKPRMHCFEGADAVTEKNMMSQIGG